MHVQHWWLATDSDTQKEKNEKSLKINFWQKVNTCLPKNLQEKMTWSVLDDQPAKKKINS